MRFDDTVPPHVHGPTDAEILARLNKIRQTQYRDAFIITFVIIVVLLTIGLATYDPFDRAKPSISSARVSLDPNTAAWFELAHLPGIGESVARRIVDYREHHRGISGPMLFRQPGDLLVVHGIGPRTLQRIGPFLRFDKKSPD